MFFVEHCISAPVDQRCTHGQCQVTHTLSPKALGPCRPYPAVIFTTSGVSGPHTQHICGNLPTQSSLLIFVARPESLLTRV
jgi:hypothetical protein